MFNIVKVIDEERKKQNLSWEELSRRAGISSAATRMWRYRGSEPGVDKVDRVLKALGISVTIGK